MPKHSVREAISQKPRRRSEGASVATSKPTRRSQHERSAVARKRLLDSAITLICEKGSAAATMAEIASAVEMTRGAIQHHFANRDEFVLAILKELDRQLASAFAAIAPDPADKPLERIERLIDQISALSQTSASLAIFDVWTGTRSEPSIRAEALELMSRSTDQYWTVWHHQLEGLLPAPVIRECFHMVITMMQGIAMSRMLALPPDSIGRSLAACRKIVLEYVRNALDA